MKQYLLFAGTESSKTVGVNGFVGDFDSIAEAFLHIVDHQTPSEWWHVLDTQTGEVVERRHIRMSNGMIGFHRSDWVIGSKAPKDSASATAKGTDLSELEAGLRSVVVNGVKNGGAHANGHAEAAAPGH
jgi:hypothetical protein